MHKVKIFKFILTISIALVLLSIPLSIFLNFSGYYFSKFKQLSIYKDFEETETAVNTRFSEMLNFINGREHNLNQYFWSNEDKLHLSDVRHLVISFNALVTLNSIFLLILFFKKQNLLTENLEFAFKGAGVIFLVSLILIIINFQNAFIIFHKILFRNDYWMLDPTTSNLIKYFPQQIFFEIGLFTFFFAIITSIIGFLWISRRKKSSLLVGI